MMANFMKHNSRPKLEQLTKADPYYLLHAIAIVNARYEITGKKPGSEKWQSDTRHYRRLMIESVISEWIKLTGTDVVFPWHDDYVAEVWVAFRKTSTMKKSEIWDHFGIVPPKDGCDIRGHAEHGGLCGPVAEIVED